MQFKRPKRAPVFLALLVLALVCAVRLGNPDFADRLERMTYDLRVRIAQKFPSPAATNLAFVSMEESSIAAVRNGKVGFHFGLYWPREVYGRLVDELSEEGAQAVAFDVLFGELRPDHPQVQMADGSFLHSDDFFALQMRHAGNVLIAATSDILPPELFATNALALGEISTEKDSDGILRRVKAFRMVRRWHPLFRKLEATPELAVDLTNAVFITGKIILPQTGLSNSIEIALDAENNFAPADFFGDKIPPNLPPKAKAFTDERVWHMGIVLAAQELQLDLIHADVDIKHGRITLHGAHGIERVIPVDANGYFYVNWGLKLARMPIENLLWQDRQRLRGETNGLRNDFKGKLVVVGSAVQGNDLTDRGATPLESDTLLVSKHWNVANSILTGQFIRRASWPLEIVLIILLGAATALLTWELRAVAGSIAVILLMVAYFGATVFLFIQFRWWLPVVYPLGGAILILHGLLLIHRVVFEEHDKRRVKNVFSKLVSPHVVNELLSVEKLELGGAHCEITVFFADVRGFTALTDQMQEQIAEFVRTKEIENSRAEKYFEESARETLEIVNLYLATVAEAVKKNGGTLDKYIGDCVMAFWNAPTPNEKHALDCIQAAIDAQRGILALNEKRLAENSAREIENQARIAAGQPPKPLHISLQLGTGINTGLVTVGLMGSDDHGFNYTVFGREVNLASRLEGVSGSGRIIISDTTYYQLLRHAPELASTCAELMPVKPKGFTNPVRIYEVPWQNK